MRCDEKVLYMYWFILKNHYAGLYGFIPCLYAITLCCTLYQALCQVYAARAPLGFMPGRLSSCKNLQHLQTSSKIPQYLQGFYQPTVCILSNMFPSSVPRPRESQRQPWPLGRSPPGTPVLMNSVRPWPRGRSPPGRPFS